MSTITLRKVSIFLVSKELYESIMILPKLSLLLFVIPVFVLIGYLILSQSLLNNL